jgi:hypothetical protein
VLRLCSVKHRAEAQGEFRGILYRQNEMLETQCSLFPIYGRLPKLNVAGSIPVSRSTVTRRFTMPTTAPPLLDSGFDLVLFGWGRSWRIAQSGAKITVSVFETVLDFLLRGNFFLVHRFERITHRLNFMDAVGNSFTFNNCQISH